MLSELDYKSLFFTLIDQLSEVCLIDQLSEVCEGAERPMEHVVLSTRAALCQQGVQLTRAAGVGIAVTAAAAAGVLLLDEPTARVNSSEVEQAAE